MKRHYLVLFMVTTFLLTSHGLSSVEAKPFKGFKASPKKVKSFKLGLPTAKAKLAFPKPIPKPFPKPIPKPIPKPFPIPSVVVSPRPVVISVGVVRPIRRTYVRSTVVVPIVRRPAPMKIVKILDTTHVVVSQSGSTQTVRLLGLDAVTSKEVYPEVHEEALTYMRKEFVGQIVYLDFDDAVGSEDQEGTRIAYVYRSEDKQLVNEDVIENGFALAAMAYNYQQKTDFQRDQVRAERTQSGVWSAVPKQGG